MVENDVFLLFEVRDDARAAGEDNEDMSTCGGSNVEEGGRTVKDNEGGSGRGRSRKSSTRVASGPSQKSDVAALIAAAGKGGAAGADRSWLVQHALGEQRAFSGACGREDGCSWIRWKVAGV
jgi:hypothetical protein